MIQTVEPGIPVPDRYTAYVDAMIDTLKATVATHGKSDPFIVIGSLTDGWAMPVYGITELPFELGCAAITETARKINAEFVMISRTLIGANAKTREEAEAMAAKYKRPEDCPNAQRVAFVSLETYHGVWVAVKPVEVVDGVSTIGDMELSSCEPLMSTLNLLPPRTPLQ